MNIIVRRFGKKINIQRAIELGYITIEEKSIIPNVTSVICQSTNLFDMNGKEIYVGDILIDWLPIIISIGIPFAATAIMTFIMGEPCNYKEFLKCLTIKFSAKKIKTYLKDADLSCEVNLNEISNMINERQKLLDNNYRELYDIDIENGKIEYAIRRMDNLSI